MKDIDKKLLKDKGFLIPVILGLLGVLYLAAAFGSSALLGLALLSLLSGALTCLVGLQDDLTKEEKLKLKSELHAKRHNINKNKDK